MEKNKLDYSHFLAMIAFVLIAIGVVFVCSAQANVGIEFNFRRVYFSAGGLLAVIVFSFVPYKLFALPARGEFGSALSQLTGGEQKFAAICKIARCLILPFFLILVAAALLYVLLGPVRSINASRRWVIFLEDTPYEIRFQPSELIKLAVVFFLAAYTVRFGAVMRKFSLIGIARAVRRLFTGELTFGHAVSQVMLLAPFYAIPAFFVGIIAIEDFGTAAFIAIVMFIMLLAARTPYWQLISCTVVGVVGSYYYISQEQYRLNRMIAFMDIDKATDAIKYQIVNSMTAISTGGFYGKGLGRGVFKWGYVPEDRTDFIFSIICEELGVVGAASVVLLFLLFLLLGFTVALKCKDPHGRLLAIGLSSAICVQALVNIGVVTSSLPTTGIPLPFISAGGSSLLASSLAVGLLMNIARSNCKSEQLDGSEL